MLTITKLVKSGAEVYGISPKPKLKVGYSVKNKMIANIQEKHRLQINWLNKTEKFMMEQIRKTLTNNLPSDQRENVTYIFKDLQSSINLSNLIKFNEHDHQLEIKIFLLNDIPNINRKNIADSKLMAIEGNQLPLMAMNLIKWIREQRDNILLKVNNIFKTVSVFGLRIYTYVLKKYVDKLELA